MHGAQPRYGSSRRWTLLVLLVGFIVYLPVRGRPLRDSEAKYAEIPREMLELGTWASPHLNYDTYPAKPPLTFWVTMAAYRAFGASEDMGRAVTILWNLLTAWLIARLADAMFGARHGPLAAGLWLCTVGVYVFCLDIGIEVSLVACQVAAVLFFWRAHQSRALVPLCGFYAAMALGVLAKGLPAVAIPAGVAGAFLVSRRQWRELRWLLHPAAAATGLVILAPWIALNLSLNPGFLTAFFLEEHLYRFLGMMTSNDALLPTSAWLGKVVGQLFPWVLYLPLVGLGVWHHTQQGSTRATPLQVLVIWAIVPVLIYGTSRSKCDHYCLEVYPPLVLLLVPFVRALIDGTSEFSPRAWATPWFLVSIGAVVVILWLQTGKAPDLQIPQHTVLLALAAIVVLAALAGGSLSRGWSRVAALAVAGVVLVLFAVLRERAVASLPVTSMKFAADYFNAVRDPRAVLVTDERSDEYEHVAILPFYTHRPAYLLRNEDVSILHFRDEARNAECLDNDGLLDLARQRTVYLVGDTDPVRARLARLGLTGTEVVHSGARTLFRLAP